VVRIA
jgi:hypothetical protein